MLIIVSEVPTEGMLLPKKQNLHLKKKKIFMDQSTSHNSLLNPKILQINDIYKYLSFTKRQFLLN